MTVVPVLGRTIPRQLASRSTCLPASSTLRVASAQLPAAPTKLPFSDISLPNRLLWSKRTYATAPAAPKRAVKPRSSSRTEKPAGKKPAAKKPAKKKPAKKTAKKLKTIAKRKTKAKAKAKPKRKVLTEAQKEKRKAAKTAKDATAKRKVLKEAALLNQEPKRLPATAYLVVAVESSKGHSNITGSAKAAAEKYKNLSPSEREHYNHIANENRSKNEADYRKWVSSFSPTQIRAANSARKHLSVEKKKNTIRISSSSLKPIQDDRLVTRQRTSYVYFVQDRFASGDFAGLAIAEAGKLLSREWKALSASGKKPYNDQAAGDLVRYKAEHKTVYGEDVPSKSARKTKKA